GRTAAVWLGAADCDAGIVEQPEQLVWAEYAREPGCRAGAVHHRSELAFGQSDWPVHSQSGSVGESGAGAIGHLVALLQRFPAAAAAERIDQPGADVPGAGTANTRSPGGVFQRVQPDLPELGHGDQPAG